MLHLTTYGNTSKAYISESVETAEGLIVQRYGICGTNMIAYDVYERKAGLNHTHSGITHNDTYGWLGDITTVMLPVALDALPAYSQERSDAVQAFYQAARDRAEAIVRATFPADFQ